MTPTSSLSELEKQKMYTEAPEIDTFDNPRPNRDYVNSIKVAEFTSVCPKTGLPDFGTISIDYVADQKCLELKSLKYYFLSYRNRGIFYEAVTNQILDDLVATCQPRFMEVTGEFSPRGAISSTIVATYRKEGFEFKP